METHLSTPSWQSVLVLQEVLGFSHLLLVFPCCFFSKRGLGPTDLTKCSRLWLVAATLAQDGSQCCVLAVTQRPEPRAAGTSHSSSTAMPWQLCLRAQRVWSNVCAVCLSQALKAKCSDGS